MVDPDATRTVTLPLAGESQLAQLPRVGDVVDGKYRVDRILGQGGMGVVVAVTHLQLGEPYAMKFLLPEAANNEEALARFMREAKAAVRIKSEHVARVSDVGQLPNGCPYIVMEYLIGTDLGDRLRERGRCEIPEAVEYVLQACVGIAEAHARGIVHRDLKPSNLYLTKRLDGAPLIKVLDFGISKTLGDSPERAEITKSHSVFGSPAYMAPEQLKSAKNADERSDVWSLGVILYKLIANEPPFEADTYAGVISAVLGDPPRSLRKLRPDVDPELERVIVRCLDKDASKRFQSVADLAVALEPFKPDGSRVSVGRIVRLASISDPSVPPPSEPITGTGRGEKRGSLNPTNQPWVASAETAYQQRKARSMRVVALAAGGATLLVLGLYATTLRRPAPPPAPPTTASLPPSTPTTVETVAAPPVTAPVETSSAPPPAMTTSARGPTTAKPSTPTKTRVRPAVRPASNGSSSPNTPPSGATKLDPTAESH